jgi:hypothetical protein
MMTPITRRTTPIRLRGNVLGRRQLDEVEE